MPSPHYITQTKRHHVLHHAHSRSPGSDGSVVDAVAAAASNSSNGTSISRLKTSTNCSTSEFVNYSGSSYSVPDHQTTRSQDHLSSRGARNIIAMKNKHEFLRSKDSQSLPYSMHSGQHSGSNSTAHVRRIPGSPILVRATNRGNNRTTTIASSASTSSTNTTTSTTHSLLQNEVNKDHIPNHDLFPSDTKHDSKNKRGNECNQENEENHEADDGNNSTTSDATSNSTRSSVSSSGSCSAGEVPLGNAGSKYIGQRRDFQDKQKECNGLTGALNSSSASAAAALMGLQQHQAPGTSFVPKGHDSNEGNPIQRKNKSGDTKFSSNLVEEPHENDVVSGRGNGANRRPGNIRFRDIVAKYKDMYLYAKAADKKLIARNVVRDVEMIDPPGRFLVQDANTGMWTVLDKRKTLRKVAQALREPSFRKFHGSSKESRTSSVDQQSPDAISDYSTVDYRNEEHMEEELKGDICVKPSISTENGTRHKRILNRACVDASGITKPQSIAFVNASQPPTDVPMSHESGGDDGNVPQSAICPTNMTSQKLQGVPLIFDNSARTTINPAFSGINYQVTSSQDAGLIGKTILYTGENHHGQQQPFVDYQGNVAYSDPSRINFHSKGSGRQEISMPYIMNYTNMAVKSITSTVTTELCAANMEKTVASDHTDSLKNISVVASTCNDLTALYLIVRFGSEAFTMASFQKTYGILPTQYDVLLNADDIQNHPGNLYLAETVQRFYTDYMNAELSGRSKSSIIDHIVSTVTREKPTSLGSQVRGTVPKARFLVRSSIPSSSHTTNSASPGSDAWSVVPKKKVTEIVESLLQQACAFILHPEMNDVLFGRNDISRLSPGNMYFNSLVDRCKSLYMQTSPEGQLQCAVEVVGIITSRPGRFLGNIEEMGMWMPLTFEAAIEKTQRHLSGAL